MSIDFAALRQRLSSGRASTLSRLSGVLNRFVLLDVPVLRYAMRYLDAWLPLVLATVLGVALAVCIVLEAWHVAIIVAVLVPAAIVLHSYPTAALMVWLLLAPFVQVTPTQAYRVAYWMLHRALIPGTLLVVIIARVSGVRRSLASKLELPDLAMVASLGLILLSVFVHQKDPVRLLPAVYDRLLVPFCAHWLIRFTTSGKEDLRRLLPILSIIVVSEATIGAISWLAPGLLPAYWLKWQGERTAGTFWGYAPFTTALVSYGLLLLHAAVSRKADLVRLTYLSAAAFAAMGVFLSFSRGSWLGALVVGLGLIGIYPKVAARLALIVLVVAAILGSTIMSEQFVWAKQRLMTERTVYDRLVIYSSAVQMIKAKPLLGWGYEMYDEYDWRFQSRVANYVMQVNETSHNLFLTILAEQGLVGAFLYYFALFWWLRLTFQVWARMPKEGFWSRKLIAALWLSILFQAVVTNFTDTQHDTFVSTVWWMWLGFVASTAGHYVQSDDLARSW